MQPPRLKFGAFIAPYHKPGINPTLAMDQDMQLVEQLDFLGYDEAWIGEHHSTGTEIIASPEIFIAAAAQRTRHIRLGTGVTSIAYHNPLWVADRMVQLDHMTRGRVMLGMGPGSLPTDSAMIGLTPTDTRDEDPKFSPDGKRIVFKRRLADDSWRIAEMELATRHITLLPFADDEYSMPYYNADGTKIVASKGGGSHAQSSIVVINLQNNSMQTLYDAPGVQDYYPINADATSFYYSSGHSPQWPGDQVWRGYWNGAPAQRLPFNDTEGDYSDATPAGSDWVVISSTRPGGAGSYDLYIANTQSGAIFPMTDYHSGINTPLAELGPTVFIRE